LQLAEIKKLPYLIDQMISLKQLSDSEIKFQHHSIFQMASFKQLGDSEI
jgi:hypothetical protein